MEGVCGEADGDGGEEGEAEEDEEKKEGDRLKVKTAETEQLWELTVELGEEVKVIILLNHHSIEDDRGAFYVKE